MMRSGRRASLLVALCLLSGCASRWEPNAAFKQTALDSQTVLSATQRLREKTGIDGDPIQLDDERYRDYLDKVRSAIKAKWGYPCVRDAATGHCEYKSAEVVIVFGLLKDGRVPGAWPQHPVGVQIAESSGADVMDQYAVIAIFLASPFPPVPEAMLHGHGGVPVVTRFHYTRR
jgi:outer membrane biosynthesis protein TonB